MLGLLGLRLGLLGLGLVLCLFLSCHADNKSDFVGNQTGLWLSHLVYDCLLPQLLVFFLQ